MGAGKSEGVGGGFAQPQPRRQVQAKIDAIAPPVPKWNVAAEGDVVLGDAMKALDHLVRKRRWFYNTPAAGSPYCVVFDVLSMFNLLLV